MECMVRKYFLKLQFTQGSLNTNFLYNVLGKKYNKVCNIPFYKYAGRMGETEFLSQKQKLVPPKFIYLYSFEICLGLRTHYSN